MATYIILLNFTEQGIAHIKDSPARLDAARKAVQAAGGELIQWFLVMGQYDAVIIGEAPNDEAVAKVLLMIGSTGFVRTQTLKAFSEDEYRKIVASLP